MSWVAVAVGGGAIIGGTIQAIGANQAAKTQAAAGQAAIQEQAREFDINQKNLAPYIQAGQGALSTLQQEMGPGGRLNTPFSFDVTADPGYQFRLSQGTTSIENSAAARGMQLSSANLKDLVRFGQDYASGEYNQAFNRNLASTNQRFSELSAVAGMGQGATNTGVQAGTATAGSIANTMTGIGNATAAGQVGVANAIGGAIGGAGNAFLLSSILNQGKTPVSPVSGGALDMAGPG